MSLDQKSIGQMSCNQHIIVTLVGQNVRTSNVAVNWGDGS